MHKPLVYLACPYSHPDPAVRAQRFDAVNRAAAVLMKQGHYVYSPISHSHPIAEVSDLPTDFEYWQKYCYAFLNHCYKIVVLTLPGWQESVGVTGELAFAHEHDIEIEYLDPKCLT